MERDLPAFSPEQWEFLATLEALSEAVPLDMLEILIALTPGQLLDLIHRATQLGLIECTGDQAYGLASDIPAPIRAKLKGINDQTLLQGLLHTLEGHESLASRRPGLLIALLARAGRTFDACSLEDDLARDLMERGELEEALHHLLNAVNRLKPLLGQPEGDALFVRAILKLTNLQLRLGRNVDQVHAWLKQGIDTASRQDDRESLVFLSIMSSRLFQFHGTLAEALTTINSTLRRVEKLGGENMRNNSAELLGYYYYIQGMYKEAVGQFELIHEKITFPFNRVFHSIYLGHAYAFLGQFHQAVGVLDSLCHRVLLKSEHRIAPFMQADLGLVLLAMHKQDEALPHLQDALRDGRECGNFWAVYRAQLGLAYHAYLEGNSMASHAITRRAAATAAQTGFLLPLKNICWPWLLELLFEYDQLGLEPIEHLEFPQELERILGGVNIHQRGIALRIQARIQAASGAGEGEVLRLLGCSEADLKRSGDPVQLAKTRLEIARIRLRARDEEGARRLALEAWEGLSGYDDDAFPEDLKPLLEKRPVPPRQPRPQEDILREFLETMRTYLPGMDQETRYQGLVSATTSFFRAERGERPTLKTGKNLSSADVASTGFRPLIQLIIKSYRNRQLLFIRPRSGRCHPEGLQSLAVLCIPFTVKGELRGVLFHDNNTYVDENSHLLDRAILTRIGRYISACIEEIEGYPRQDHKAFRIITESPTGLVRPSKAQIKVESAVMRELMEQAGQVAQSEASVLILGETGVGKEVLARNIHALSPRHEGPFVVVDPGSMPENLVESELFGHEKGAFTGADARKHGRMEMAHGGTLFIDEVGDIPLSSQVKLLRALQERCITRVGGNEIIHSDFRLLAATNKNLEKAVSEGRFREDLYYRLNVIPLTVPPLRERGRDVIHLARFFLEQYARTYNRGALALSPQDEEQLMSYHWPGNVRELKNVMERAVILSTDGRLEFALSIEHPMNVTDQFADTPSMEELQRRYITYVIEKCGGRLGGEGGACAVLGMKRSTLYSRMRKLGMV